MRRGFAAVKSKAEWWTAHHEIHSSAVEGPLVAGSHFAVTFKMDVTFKPQARRFKLEEVAVYKLSDGKILYDNSSTACRRALRADGAVAC
jgi:hypothetical protein